MAELPDQACITAAESIAAQTLPLPAVTENRYGVAFVTVHQAAMFNQIIVDWWERENELRHRVFQAWPEAPYDFREITASGEAFCVWELKVIAFERDAWMSHVLTPPGGTDWEGYLQQKLSGDF